jgi:hypothetical protein
MEFVESQHEQHPTEGCRIVALGRMMGRDTGTEATMAEPAVSASGHRMRWGWRLVALVGFLTAAALIGYQIVQPFSDWVNDVLGSLSIGE